MRLKPRRVKRSRKWSLGPWAVGCLLLVGVAIAFPGASAQEPPTATNANSVDAESAKTPATADVSPPPGDDAAPVDPSNPPPPSKPSKLSPGERYGLWSAMPAIVAILLAIATRQVIPALVIGLLVGAYMLVPCLPPDDALAGVPSWIAGARLAVEHVFFSTLRQSDKATPEHLMIVVFTLVIGFTVGVMARSGGTAGMVRLVAGSSNSRRRGTLTAWLAGLVVFFDDYANTMIIGPTMQPVFDRLRLSRAKLAYIVDSTAAPVASLALIGTWVGTEIGYIQLGLDTATGDFVPPFLMDSSGVGVLNGMQVFINSLPYRFYAILALVMVLLVAVTGRDFGPMRASERRAAEGLASKGQEPFGNSTGEAGPTPNWVLGIVPVLVLIGTTVGVLMITGYYATDPDALAKADALWRKLNILVEHADSYLSILYGALTSAVVAVVLASVARACKLRESMDAGLEGMSRMFPAIVILVLAWSLSEVLTDLQLGSVVAGHLKAAAFPVQWMSLAVFASAAFISFATGTSWGTMGILCPTVVEITVRLIEHEPGISPEFAAVQFYGAVGAVLAGSIFGDHCSPISDTTVLSSLASGCRHEEHVWTQMPYALVTAVASMGLGDVLCSAYGVEWYWGLVAGSGFLLFVLLVFGRGTRVDPEADESGSNRKEPSPLRRRLLERMQEPPGESGS
ncbi:MAG: Na+/H+ antiporter NhaC family protein [Phycisphaerae bacterium]|nr:Na+/H+ antiporter NhaC family protein [Phycisphaerae bacterium]